MIRAIFLLSALVAGSVSAAGLEILDVVSSVNYRKAPPISGGLTTIFTKGLTGIEGTIIPDEFPRPKEVAGVSVTIYGKSAAILMVSQLDGYQQINVQVPWQTRAAWNLYSFVPPPGPALVVKQGEFHVEIEEFKAEIGKGTWDPVFVDESNFALAYHNQDLSPVTTANPVRAGETITLFASNLGDVTPCRRRAERSQKRVLRACSFLTRPGPCRSFVLCSMSDGTIR